MRTILQHYPGGYNKHYDDAFEKMIECVETRVRRGRIKDEETLRRMFKEVDSRRKDQAGRPRVSDTFIDILMTRQEKIDKYVGRTIGREEPPRIMRREYAEVVKGRVRKLRDSGIHPYEYEGGYAYKQKIVYARGTPIYVFRDVLTGRFVAGKQLRDN